MYHCVTRARATTYGNVIVGAVSQLQLIEMIVGQKENIRTPKRFAKKHVQDRLEEGMHWSKMF